MVVPVGVTSVKREYAARTIRPKIHRRLRPFLDPLPPHRPRQASTYTELDSLNLGDVDAIVNALDIDATVPVVSHFFDLCS